MHESAMVNQNTNVNWGILKKQFFAIVLCLSPAPALRLNDSTIQFEPRRPTHCLCSVEVEARQNTFSVKWTFSLSLKGVLRLIHL